MDRVNRKNRLVAAVMHHIQHYNPDTYWKTLNFVATSRGLLQNVSYANIPKNQGFRKK